LPLLLRYGLLLPLFVGSLLPLNVATFGCVPDVGYVPLLRVLIIRVRCCGLVPRRVRFTSCCLPAFVDSCIPFVSLLFCYALLPRALFLLYRACVGFTFACIWLRLVALRCRADVASVLADVALRLYLLFPFLLLADVSFRVDVDVMRVRAFACVGCGCRAFVVRCSRSLIAFAVRCCCFARRYVVTVTVVTVALPRLRAVAALLPRCALRAGTLHYSFRVAAAFVPIVITVLITVCLLRCSIARCRC